MALLSISQADICTLSSLNMCIQAGAKIVSAMQDS